MSCCDRSNTFGPPHRVVEVAEWHDAVAALKSEGYTYFDWLSAVDEHPEGFRLVVHLARLEELDHLLLVTYVDRESPAVASIADLYAGAAWHERETHEMFGIEFRSRRSSHCCCRMVSRGIRCARSSCSPPVSPRRGRAPRSRGRATRTRRTRRVVAASSRPASPIRPNGVRSA